MRVGSVRHQQPCAWPCAADACRRRRLSGASQAVRRAARGGSSKGPCTAARSAAHRRAVQVSAENRDGAPVTAAPSSTPAALEAGGSTLLRPSAGFRLFSNVHPETLKHEPGTVWGAAALGAVQTGHALPVHSPTWGATRACSTACGCLAGAPRTHTRTQPAPPSSLLLQLRAPQWERASWRCLPSQRAQASSPLQQRWRPSVVTTCSQGCSSQVRRRSLTPACAGLGRGAWSGAGLRLPLHACRRRRKAQRPASAAPSLPTRASCPPPAPPAMGPSRRQTSNPLLFPFSGMLLCFRLEEVNLSFLCEMGASRGVSLRWVSRSGLLLLGGGCWWRRATRAGLNRRGDRACAHSKSVCVHAQ